MKTKINIKKYLLLLTLIVNLVPYIQDGNMKWTTSYAGAQQYMVEQRLPIVTSEPYTISYLYFCVNVADPNDNFWSGYSNCIINLNEVVVTPDEDENESDDDVFLCSECGAILAHDGAPCPYPNCPNHEPSNDDDDDDNEPDGGGPSVVPDDTPDGSGTPSGDPSIPPDNNNNGTPDSNGGTPVGGNNTPCTDVAQGKSNPLVHMELAPPNPDKPLGGTFGEGVRNNGEDDHWGYDLGGSVGTPVYATHSGTIAYAPKVVDKQPNRIYNSKTRKYEYPAGYSGDKDGGGNRIYINIGDNIQVAYFHLQVGTPIATNPREDRPFKAGDQIYQGEIIGYIGVTGNASPNVPHLHYGVKKNGVWINPLPYINTTKDSNHKLSTPCD